MRKLIACFLGLFWINGAQASGGADSLLKRLAVGAEAYGGYLWAHKPVIANMEAHVFAFALQAQLRADGSKDWHVAYKYPRVGVSLLYTNFGRPELTGFSFSAVPFIDFPVYKNKKNEIAIRTGAGIAYFSRAFDIKTNYKNKGIGAPYSVALQLFFLYRRTIFRNIEGNIGIGLAHFSNGKLEQPNYGINIPQILLGATYLFSKTDVEKKRVLPPFKPKWGLQTFLAIANKDEGGILSDRYTTLTLGVAGSRALNRKSILTAGGDFFYDPSLPLFVYPDSLRETGAVKVGFTDKIQVGVKAGHDLVLGRFHIVTQFGMYAYTPTSFNGKFYQRVGFRVRCWKGAFVGLYLKTHFARADFAEWALGWAF